MKIIRKIVPLLILTLLVAAAVLYLQSLAGVEETGPLKASGTIEATEVTAAPQIGGRVEEVFVAKGDTVTRGDPLYRLSDLVLQARLEGAQKSLESAQAAAETAQAAVHSAEAALNAAQVNYRNTLEAARQEEAARRAAAWQADQPEEFKLPVWYYRQDEDLEAAQAAVEAAQQALDESQGNFERVRQAASSSDFVAAEKRLAEAQSVFRVAQTVLERADAQNDQRLKDEAQSQFDAAKAELESAQLEYDRILTTQAAQDVLEARARLTVAQERYDSALDYLRSLQTGEHSLQVQAAQAAVEQAQAQLEQAQAAARQAQTAVEQAQAQVALVQAQVDELTVRASVDGVVLARDVEPGEVLLPGSAALVIGEVGSLHITVYLPEDRYGEVRLGQEARVSVDSFPGETFSATVTRIADKAEYTPRNVQTAEGRRTTVFAVELRLTDPSGRLKPGMPADVVFGVGIGD